MHVAFLTPEYPDSRRPDGGLGNYIRKTGLELVRRGHEATVFVLSHKNRTWNDHGIRVSQLNSFRFHWRMRKIRGLSRWLDLCERWINGKRLKKFVFRTHRTKQIDILQTSNYLAPGIEFCRNGQIPLVCRCSSYMPPLRAANGQQRNLKTTIEDWREIITILRADAAFIPSEFVANLFERYEAFRPRVIRTPVGMPPTEIDDSIYLEHLRDKRYLLHFGTLMGVKGTDLLVRITPKLLDSFPDLHIALIGANGPLPSGKSAAECIHDELSRFGERVFFHPPLQKPQLSAVVRHAYGVVMPSRVDNYPNACLEAFSLGVPVVGTDQSSLEEMIIPGMTGFLARNNDPESLFNEIVRLLVMSESNYQQMKANIQDCVEAMRREDRVGKLLDFYQETIDNYRKQSLP